MTEKITGNDNNMRLTKMPQWIKRFLLYTVPASVIASSIQGCENSEKNPSIITFDKKIMDTVRHNVSDGIYADIHYTTMVNGNRCEIHELARYINESKTNLESDFFTIKVLVEHMFYDSNGNELYTLSDKKEYEIAIYKDGVLRYVKGPLMDSFGKIINENMIIYKYFRGNDQKYAEGVNLFEPTFGMNRKVVSGFEPYTTDRYSRYAVEVLHKAQKTTTDFLVKNPKQKHTFHLPKAKKQKPKNNVKKINH